MPILLKMILDISIYNEYMSNVINNQDSQPNIDSLFCLLAMLLQQKRIDELNIKCKKESYADFIRI
ncbi:MAG: hypothetical protein ACTHJ7_08560 [Candidatus Nitrosocosmicus sp.]